MSEWFWWMLASYRYRKREHRWSGSYLPHTHQTHKEASRLWWRYMCVPTSSRVPKSLLSSPPIVSLPGSPSPWPSHELSPISSYCRPLNNSKWQISKSPPTWRDFKGLDLGVWFWIWNLRVGFKSVVEEFNERVIYRIFDLGDFFLLL